MSATQRPTLLFVPECGAYAPGDSRTTEAVETLRLSLARLGRPAKARIPRPHTKGDVWGFAISLVQAGAVAAVVTLFREWLRRPGGRVISIPHPTSGRMIKITGENISEATLRQALRASMKLLTPQSMRRKPPGRERKPRSGSRPS